jgi:hypothetical protein
MARPLTPEEAVELIMQLRERGRESSESREPRRRAYIKRGWGREARRPKLPAEPEPQ